jgi:hypothetical protein
MYKWKEYWRIYLDTLDERKISERVSETLDEREEY